MFYLKDLDKDPIKFSNIDPIKQDNSTWSVDGAPVNPPRVAVGGNTANVSVYNLQQSGAEPHTIKAHVHNIPCVSYSPCGKFIATTSLDKQVKVWEEY